jgi:hypothetical protein
MGHNVVAMTAKELLQIQFDDAGYMLDKAFDGIDESLDAKLTEQSMSPRELAAHLAECYTAILSETKGEKHQWGSYKPQSSEWPALWNEVKDLRARATEAAVNKEGWEAHANGFGPAHDYYHVGQLVALRLTKDPEWDPLSIYNWG